MDTFVVPTRKREDAVDVTGDVRRIVASSGLKEGLCVVYVPHTTAGVTINENADPDVKADILMALRAAVPETQPYAHAEGNSTAHVKATLVGSSVTVPISEGRLQLGTWQGINLCEFDGPRSRKIWIQLVSGR